MESEREINTEVDLAEVCMEKACRFLDQKDFHLEKGL